jgi:hypothetical protein
LLISYHRSEILKLNSFLIADFAEEKCEELLEGLLLESEDEFKHTRQVQQNKIPELVKYYYVKAKAFEENSTTTSEKVLSGSTDISRAEQKGALEVEVKEEFADIKGLKASLQALKTGKNKLNKHLDDASLLIAGFMRDGKDTASATADMDKVKTAAESYMSTLRNEIANFESIVKLGVEGHYKQEELHKFAENAQKAVRICSTHVDALKRKMVDSKLGK